MRAVRRLAQAYADPRLSDNARKLAEVLDRDRFSLARAVREAEAVAEEVRRTSGSLTTWRDVMAGVKELKSKSYE